MKSQTLSLYILSILFAILIISCKNDDDNQGGDTTQPIATFENSCCKISQLVACVGGVKALVPNAFSPNGDGVNDIFFPFSQQGFKQVASFTISNEDGIVVFENSNFWANDPIQGWDGSDTDGTKTDGIYSYSISLTNIKDETLVFGGQVCSRVSFPMACVDLEEHCIYGIQYDGDDGFDSGLNNGEDCE